MMPVQETKGKPMKRLYNIGWMLVSWTGSSAYTAELLDAELEELTNFFEAERSQHRLMHYFIRPATPADIRNIYAQYAGDRAAENQETADNSD